MYFSALQLIVFTLLVGGAFFILARTKAQELRRQRKVFLHSMPIYHGSYAFLYSVIPALGLALLYTLISRYTLSHQLHQLIQEAGYAESFQPLIANSILNRFHTQTAPLPSTLQPIFEHYQLTHQRLMFGRTLLTALIAIAGGFLAYRRQNAEFAARERVERALRWLMLSCAGLAILTTFGILFSVLFEALQFFHKVSPSNFFLNTLWSPQTAMRADQVGSSGSFGVLPLLIGTLLISGIALLVAVPLGLFSAIYLSEYASPRLRAFAKPMLEILAGIPTVVYGFFAALTVAPLLRHLGQTIGLSVSSESALAAGLVMGIMIIPFVSSLSDDVLTAVPQSLREGSYGLGATQSETIRRVILPAALPGIVSAILLAASRAIGETMIVVMAAGLSANLTLNPLEAVTTVTVQIVTLLQGDQEFDSAKTLAAFALGLTLFVLTFLLNLYAIHVVKKYREQYE